MNSQRKNGQYKNSRLLKYRDTNDHSNCFGNMDVSEDTASNILSNIYTMAMSTEENGETKYDIPLLKYQNRGKRAL